ncbi:MAG: aminotransferase class III-fold pyridoxal phosphate-dependent enzyme, partial [Chloroflexi bacterium]|nr:aminotransferase class III-fold pyridoxal phosphate-dependent enzyme [Chloroflexota bacterium]
MTDARPRSHEIFASAQEVMPGGVNSPVRAFQAVGGEPPIIAYGKGARLFDVDSNEYIDYMLSWGPLILGHAHPTIIAIIQRAAERG